MKITPEIRRRAAAYPKSVRWSDEDDVFIGSIEGLCGDCDHGSDPVVVFRTLKRLAEETIAQWDAAGLTLPNPPSTNGSNTPASQVAPPRRRQGAAKALLKIAASNPHAVRQALHTA
jgi:hypothetical protein